MRNAAIAAICIFRNLLLPNTLYVCRFVPSCGQYAGLAIERYGTVRGLWLAGRRLLRCHPPSQGGFDPLR